MAKAGKDQNGKILWHCVGCGFVHAIDPQKWTFNDDFEKPTFSPSVLLKRSWKRIPQVCHCFVRDGKIQYLNDCTHDLAGQTVDMVDF